MSRGGQTPPREAPKTRRGSDPLLFHFTKGSDPWVSTYDVRYIKVTAVGQAGQDIGINELDILGPSGDNIEFTDDEGKLTIGKLSSDYVYDKNSGQKIPAGSIVFAGSYKGNPAYNVVVLYDQNGSIVGGTNDAGELIAQQIILAPDPGNALLGEVSEGSWIHWIFSRVMGSVRHFWKHGTMLLIRLTVFTFLIPVN